MQKCDLSDVKAEFFLRKKGSAKAMQGDNKKNYLLPLFFLSKEFLFDIIFSLDKVLVWLSR